jgi:hypothetical protein
MGITNMAVDSDERVIAKEDEYTYLLDISQQPPQILCGNRGICQSSSLIDTFGEYSPQNTDFVRILTDLGTPSQTNVSKRVNSVQEDHGVTISQSSQHGEYILQQDIIEKLDHELSDLPIIVYV